MYMANVLGEPCEDVHECMYTIFPAHQEHIYTTACTKVAKHIGNVPGSIPASPRKILI